MRILLIAVALLSIGSMVAAAYTPKTVENFMAYANVVSRTYAEGDSNDDSGWRECVEAESDGGNDVGVTCEGVRAILVHGGKMVDVNYYCEFIFTKLGSFRFKVATEVCQ